MTNRRLSRARTSFAAAVTTATLVLLATACNGKDLASADPAGVPSASAPRATVAGSTVASEDASSQQPADSPPATSTPSGRPTAAGSPAGAPAGKPSPHPTSFIKLTERYRMPNDVYIAVNDVQTLDSAEGVDAPADSNRAYVAVEIRNDGARPLPLNGKVRVTVKRQDNGTAMKQVDWLPDANTKAGFSMVTLQPGEHYEAALGFALEQSGYEQGFGIYVTLDQPGSPAYPAKFLYVPAMG